MNTGNFQTDFFRWLQNAYYFNSSMNSVKATYGSYERCCQQAFILEFFDTVGMHVYPCIPNETGYWAHSLENKAKYNNRLEAVESGISMAIELYENK